MHANTTLEPTPIDVCVECVQILANGVDPDEERPETVDAARGLAERWPGEDAVTTPAVTLGRMPDDDEGDDPWFAWTACDGCGSTLGGDRHPATGWCSP
jgi:hypothetical protein